MKPTRLAFPSGDLLVALWVMAVPCSMAETNERSVDPVPESTDSRPAIPLPNTSPARLSATIKPVEKSVTTGGTIEFFMVGDAATMIGRITGLEPNKRYQALIRLPISPATSQVGQAEPTVEADLGMLVADANGIANLKASIPRKNLGPAPSGIQGCAIVIKRAPPFDSREERNPVGSGTIVPSGPIAPVPANP
jgi:hypothetical protein